MADYYKSIYSGAQIDTSLGRIINGELDTAVDGANAAAGRAESAADAIQDAIDNLPVGAVPVIDDLTTGGRTVALSAEQGTVLRDAAYSAQSTANEAVMATSEHEARTDNPHAVTAAQTGAIPASEKGAPNGVAPLDSHGKLPAGNLLLSNDNLLDNAWFEVNQRGQSSYDAAGGFPIYTVDRWKTWGIVEVWPSHITSILTSQYHRIEQGIEYFQPLIGQTITFSALVRGPAGQVLRFGLFKNNAAFLGDAANYTLKTSDWEIATFTIATHADAVTTLDTFFYTAFQAGGGSLDIKATKLELGSVSTLHLDTPPSPAEQELNRQVCRRYYRLWTSESGRANALTEVNLMRLYTPTLGSISVGGSTYYYASADL